MLVELLCKIPASFWGIVFGSLLSLGSVALTNRAGDRRLRAQLEHERLQKTKDREMALRKEVFLAAAEAVAAGMSTISRFANLDLQHNQISDDYTEKAPALSKVHVIAKTETVKALVRFTSELESLFLKLFVRRLELMNEKNAIALLDSQVADFGKERDRILEMIKQHNIEGIVDARRWKVLQDNFEFEHKRIDETLNRRTVLLGTLGPKQLAFMRECIAAAADLGKLIVPVLSAVRAELELEFDEDVYRQLREDSIARQQHAIDSFIQKLATVAAQSNHPSDV